MCRRDVRIGWDENGLTLCLLESSGVWIESAEQANGAGGAHVPEAYEAGFRRFPFSIARGFGVWKNGARSKNSQVYPRPQVYPKKKEGERGRKEKEKRKKREKEKEIARLLAELPLRARRRW